SQGARSRGGRLPGVASKLLLPPLPLLLAGAPLLPLRFRLSLPLLSLPMIELLFGRRREGVECLPAVTPSPSTQSSRSIGLVACSSSSSSSSAFISSSSP